MKIRIACRACSHPNLEPYCDLGKQPLANALVTDPTKPETRYPLVLAHCPACWLSQLTVVVDPDEMYRDYAYVSGASPLWVNHCTQLADTLRVSRKLVVEIASNDGTMLQLLKSRGANAIGIEPATNLTRHYPPGLTYLPDYFTDRTARWIKTRYGKPHFVIAQNVIGHVDDIRGFLKAIAIMLHDEGTVVLEAPYLYTMLQQQEFPQVYHEHLSYWSLGPLKQLAESVGLVVTSVRPFRVHGGSMRYYLRHAGYGYDYTVPRLIQHERDMQAMPGLLASFDPTGPLEKFTSSLARYKGKVVWGYGASAKSTVLLNAAKYEGGIAAIVDDHVGKHGKFLPGVHTPIVPPQDMSEVDALVVLAWNWEEPIMERAHKLGFRGTFLLPFQGAE